MSRVNRRDFLRAGASSVLAGAMLRGGRSALAQTRGGTVTIAIAGAPATLDAQLTSSSYARDISYHLFETLYARDENGKSVPDLATGCEISSDGKTYVFELRRGVRFHNGKEMTPADVVASVNRYRKIGVTANLIEAIDTVKASGPNQVTMTLKEVQSSFLENISSPRAPLAIYPEEEATKPPEQLKLIGTGPYKFVEYVPDSHVALERFADYVPNDAYNARDGFAGRKEVYLDKVTFRFMPDQSAKVAALQAGEIQFIEDVTSSATGQLDKSRFEVYKAVPFYLEVLKFNHAASPTGDVNFRRAVAAALDMEQLMTIGYPDINILNGGWVFPSSPFANKAGLDLYNVKDLGKAGELLSKSSYKGEELTFIVEDYRPDVDVVTNIKEQLQQIGVNSTIRVADWATVEKLGFTPTGWHFWVHGMGIEPYEGPGTVMSVWVNGKSQQKDDPTINKLFTSYMAELDEAKRKQIFADFQAHMWQEAVCLPLGSYGLFQVAPKSLKNFAPYRIPRMWGVWLEA